MRAETTQDQTGQPAKAPGAQRRGRCRDCQPSPGLCLSKCPKAQWSRSSNSAERSPPQKALLDCPAPARAPLLHQCFLPHGTHWSPKSLYSFSPYCREPRAHAQCALGESTGSPRKEKSHLADTPELPGTVSPFAQRRPLDLVEPVSAFSKPRHLVCEAMLSQLGYDEPSRAACHQGLRGTPAAKPSAYRLPRSFAKWC